jgi:hypothetical protein
MKHVLLVTGLLGLAGSLLGCRGSVIADPTTSASSSSSTGSTSATSGGEGGSGGAPVSTSEGSGPGGSGPIGPGGAPVCPAAVPLAVQIDHNNVPMFKDCSLPAELDTDFVIQGAVTQSTDSTFEIDACANVDCKTNELYQVHLDNLGPASGVPFALPVGTYVELQYMRDNNYVCTYALAVLNLPMLHFVPNPIEGGSAPWLRAQGGGPSTKWPVAGSFYGAHACGVVNDKVAPWGMDMIVVADGDAAKGLPLEAGAVGTWTPGTPSLPGIYVVKNLSSQLIPMVSPKGQFKPEENFIMTRAQLN